MSVRKKLIECTLPLTEISDACGREKDVHTGLPPNLHAWWSRKPLSAARAVLVASLLDDPGEGADAERKRRQLLDLVIEAAQPELASNAALASALMSRVRAEVRGDLPAFWDPFCGGGSIPLEAFRLGLHTQASDLNPVATMITRAMIELIPAALAERRKRAELDAHEWFFREVQKYASRVKEEAERSIGHLFADVHVSELGRSVPPIAWVCSAP